MNFYKNKKVLVTGGTGLIGVPLVTKLIRKGARVVVASADSRNRYEEIKKRIPEFNHVFYEQCNLENYDNCKEATMGMDYVFQLAGSKGAGSIGTSKAATFLTSHILINLNMLKAAKENKVKKYLLTSTVGVYPPGSNYTEEVNIFSEPPAEGDKYSAWAKRISELASEAYAKEFNWKGVVIVRPGQCYGPWDNFDKTTGMVVGSLINKFNSAEYNTVVVCGKDNIRDFTYSEDVAFGMLLALEKSGNNEVFNLSIGTDYSIQQLVSYIQQYSRLTKKIIWEVSPPSSRSLNITKARKILGFNPTVELKGGIRETVGWYIENKKIVNIRYNAFKEKSDELG